MEYSLCPDRKSRRLIVTSAYSMGSAPSLLSMVRVTSARPSGGRDAVPAKTTSSILPPRSDLAPCSPITQERASTTLDLPDPFGPTTQVIPGSKRSDVAEAKDLNPRRVRLFRYTCGLSPLLGLLGASMPHSRPGASPAPPSLRCCPDAGSPFAGSTAIGPAAREGFAWWVVWTFRTFRGAETSVVRIRPWTSHFDTLIQTPTPVDTLIFAL